MNSERVLGLAYAIERTNRSFHMSKWLKSDIGIARLLGIAATHGADALVAEAERCHTFACLAGWAVLLYGDNRPGQPFKTTYEYGKGLLEITDEQARQLFTPNPFNRLAAREISCHYNDVTPVYAGRVLRQFAHTGEVNWMI